MTAHDKSIDSDEPLSSVACHLTNWNIPGTSDFVWKRKKPFMIRHGFKAIPGVKAINLDATSTAQKILDTLMLGLWETMARETNQYVEAVHPVFSHESLGEHDCGGAAPVH